jgi:hypothetical protein
LDETRRSLERAAQTGDMEARLSLERDWARQGLGWWGERMDSVAFLRRGNERGVYAFAGTLPTGGHERSEEGPTVEMIYVPGFEGPCDLCCAWNRCKDDDADGCRGTGKLTVKPYYIGRFPLTLLEWRAFGGKSLDRLPLGASAATTKEVPLFDHYPIVNVTLDDAVSYCMWRGVRLPTYSEWEHAARPIKPYVSPFDRRYIPMRDLGDGPLVREGLFPWGDEPPTQERCVWAGQPDRDRRFLTLDGHWHGETGSVAPVVIHEGYPSKGRIVAPRPAGAAWPGRRFIDDAHPYGAGPFDMCGNVWELDSCGRGHGGSYQARLIKADPNAPFNAPFKHDSPGMPDPYYREPFGHDGEAAPDTGFRIALNAESP